jgi:Rod binding domain-containing protein
MMKAIPPFATAADLTRVPALPSLPAKAAAGDAKDRETREAFQQFVGESLFGQMLKSMRKAVPRCPYFHGGRAEEIFQQRLDQVLAEKMSRTTADTLSGPMFELFTLQRK